MLSYRALIRSKLDYVCIVYNSACQTTLKTLDVVANDAIRIATGALKTTPVATLNVLVNEMPLSLRRSKLSLQYYFKILSFINNPTHPQITDLSNCRIFSQTNLPTSFAVGVYQTMNELEILRRGIKAAFSYITNNITIPTHTIKPPDVNTELTIYNKQTTPAMTHKQEFQRVKNELYKDYEAIYTDGSKTVAGVRAAAVAARGVT